MSFRMTVIVIFWIVVATIIIGDLAYMLVKYKKKNMVGKALSDVNMDSNIE